MNILLISPNTLIVPYPVYPIGLDYVAGSVSSAHKVRIADLNVVSLEKLEELLVDFSPAVIGLSCRNIDNTEAGDSHHFINGFRTLVAWLRCRSKALIVCGGSGFTIMPEQVLSALGADFGIVGEGERFSLLVDALDNGLDPLGITGVISPLGQQPPKPWAGDSVRLFQPDAPHNRFYLDRGGMLNLQSKRGCSFNCIYCPYPYIEGRKHRLVEPEKVARTALDLQDAGAKYFFITDSAFNSDINHSLAVAKAFKASGVEIPWGGFFAPVRLPSDYFVVMADAGLAHIEFGT
ncbi:MAG: cobalamin-dependent protein, partial [Deltaproteobacteria bacterium]|nr:cobalamin-dependent protein [Deltaproteobacteria bacterium]